MRPDGASMVLSTFPERKVDRLPGRTPASPKTMKWGGSEEQSFWKPFTVGPNCFHPHSLSILSPMSIRNRGGEWEPLLLGIEPEACGVCGKSLYRNLTMLRGGWSRCSVCERFIHYSCLASGKVSYLKRRPRVCQTCDTHQPPAHSDKSTSSISTKLP